MSAGDVAESAVSGVDLGDLTGVLGLLAGTPTPAGRELPLATELARWGGARHPELSWRVQPLTPGSANLLVEATLDAVTPRRWLCLYAHLDTTLSGEVAGDLPVTGTTSPVPAFTVTPEGVARGPGVAVAKGPAAAALVATVAASAALRAAGLPHRVTTLLAAGGTHRAPVPGEAAGPGSPVRGAGSGVREAVARGLRPAAAINTKCGPPGVLHEEPGSLYLQVFARGPWWPSLLRERHGPGLVAATGELLTAVEEWRAGHLARRAAGDGQMGAEVSIGALDAGLAHKPDLSPGRLALYLHVVLLPGDDPDRIAADLATSLRAAVVTEHGPVTALDVMPFGAEPAGRTPRTAPVVALAREIWTAHLGPPAEIEGWKGSTDGALLRNLGIDTARMGATPLPPSGSDARLESVRLDDLAAMARVYAESAVRFSCR